jgi:hypothetical protein
MMAVSVACSIPVPDPDPGRLGMGSGTGSHWLINRLTPSGLERCANCGLKLDKKLGGCQECRSLVSSHT